MALDLNAVKKNYKRNVDFYKIDQRDEKISPTVTPWQDFEVEEDLIDRIKSRDSVTRRIERKEFKKISKSDRPDQPNELAKATKALKKKSTYTDRMLNCKISERAQAIFSAINP